MLVDLTLNISLTSKAIFLSFAGEQIEFFETKEPGAAVIFTPRRAWFGTMKRRQNLKSSKFGLQQVTFG